MRANAEIFKAAKDAGVKIPEIADCLGIEESDLKRWLKYPVPEGTKKQVLWAIEAVANNRKEK